jgi:dTDP-4-dehydrorhamnose reductase
MKKVLVTGGNGLLGKRLRILLDSNQFVVIATGIGEDRLLNHNHSYVQLDIVNKLQCAQVLEKFNPDIIVNTSAITNVDYCQKEKSHCLKVNSEAIDNLLDFSENTHFIQISTDFIFDGNNGPYDEESAPKPINYYGFSKYEAEKKIIKKDVNYTILRTCLVYGEDNDSNNILMWVKRALKKKESLNIVDDQYRTPTFVDNLCSAIIEVINTASFGVYNISSGEYLSIFDFVCNIAKGFGFDQSLIRRSKSIDISQKAIRPVKSGLLVDKAKRDFNFNPMKITDFLNSIK